MAFRGDLEAMVLGVLSQRAAHGYDIAKSIAQMTDKLVRVGEGQLYPTLHKMERDGMIDAEWVEQSGKPSQKQYRITDQGRTELSKQQATWKKFASGMSSILGVSQVAEVNHG